MLENIASCNIFLELGMIFINFDCNFMSNNYDKNLRYLLFIKRIIE